MKEKARLKDKEVEVMAQGGGFLLDEGDEGCLARPSQLDFGCPGTPFFGFAFNFGGVRILGSGNTVIEFTGN